MKRFFIIGTFLLLLAVLSAASACAATTISSVSVTVTAPAIGAKPSYTAKLGGSTYSLDDESEDDTMENGVFWYDVTEDKFLPESFQVGHEYRVGIFLVPKAGYAFASDAKGTINGVDSFAQVYWNGK